MPVHVVRHPLVEHKMTILRNRETSVKKFRELVGEITLLLAYEATRTLETVEERIETPLCPMMGRSLRESDIVVAPILRAGLGMLDGMLSILPFARVAYIGMSRDEHTKQPNTYYFNVPSGLADSAMIIVDPMLATAGSLCGALSLVKQNRPRRIIAVCLIASPEGERRVNAEHPDVEVYVGAMDERLDSNAFIVPGLGDAGDRMFGTP